MKRTLIAFLAAVLVFSAMLLPSALPAVGVTEGNLLANPGAETGDMSGWTILENGGYGWNTRGTGYEGENSFSTSYEWCKRYQEIDLLAKGYSAFQLDAAPSVSVEEWFAGFGAVWMYDWCHEDYAYLRVELRDATHTAIATYDSGVFQLPDTTEGWWGPWINKSHVFLGYGPGLRYVYFEDGGKDREYWGHWYGTALDAASVIIFPPVGGELYPIDKLGIIAPWLALALLLAVGGGLVIMRRRFAR